MKKSIEAVIFDWAGTTVDYGCFAPVEVFLKVFKNKGVTITLEEARGPMGMLKIDHIRVLTQIPRIFEAWKEIHGTYPVEADVIALYEEFEPALLSTLEDYAAPIPGVVETVNTLRAAGLKIGSTTGYTTNMINIVKESAAKQGYIPDFVFTPDGLPAGRPKPWMCYQNAIAMEVYPMSHIVKVGDTISDVAEGINSGCWSIGVVLGSNEMGLHLEEAQAMSAEQLEIRIQAVTERYYATGAHHVIRSITDLPGAIHLIDTLLEQEAVPHKF